MKQVMVMNSGNEETISIRSRYCKKCNAMWKFECKCSNHKAMSWQMKNVFHGGKRYKGRDAWNKLHLDETELEIKEN